MVRYARNTILIAIGGALASIAVIVGFCAGFFPNIYSNATYEVGMYRASAESAERAYKKSGDIADLKILVERSIAAHADALVANYAEKFLTADGFTEIAAAADATRAEGASGTYADYIAGSFSVALYALNRKNEALSAAKKYTVDYVRFNPTEYLINAVISAKDKAFAKTLSQEMRDNYSVPVAQRTLFLQDLNMLENLAYGE